MKNYSLKDFFPIIIMYLIIIIFVIIKQILLPAIEIYSFIQSSMLDFMGFFFIIFGGFKIIKLGNFAEAYAMYDLVAKRSRSYALLYPFIEVSLGALYLLRWQLSFVNLVTLILMLISAAGVAHELLQGKKIMCACLGTVFKISMTYVTLFEDLLMILMAAIMIISALFLD
ncbi:hypothetical protein IPF37_04135 [bacterium]|nr:MAG: hypothetical protein IPF37_04135 [bacterium]